MQRKLNKLWPLVTRRVSLVGVRETMSVMGCCKSIEALLSINVSSLRVSGTILLSGAAYSNNFSTAVRVAKTNDHNADIIDRKSEGCGRYRLPGPLQRARLLIWGDRTDCDGKILQAHDEDEDIGIQETVDV